MNTDKYENTLLFSATLRASATLRVVLLDFN